MTATRANRPSTADPALGDSAIGEVRGQLQRKADDLYAVEDVGGRGARSRPA